MANRERSFIMVKHDGVQRGLVGDVIRRFEQRGFKLIAIKSVQVSSDEIFTYRIQFSLIYSQGTRAQFETHYEEHKGKID